MCASKNFCSRTPLVFSARPHRRGEDKVPVLVEVPLDLLTGVGNPVIIAVPAERIERLPVRADHGIRHVLHHVLGDDPACSPAVGLRRKSEVCPTQIRVLGIERRREFRLAPGHRERIRDAAAGVAVERQADDPFARKRLGAPGIVHPEVQGVPLAAGRRVVAVLHPVVDRHAEILGQRRLVGVLDEVHQPLVVENADDLKGEASLLLVPDTDDRLGLDDLLPALGAEHGDGVGCRARRRFGSAAGPGPVVVDVVVVDVDLAMVRTVAVDDDVFVTTHFIGEGRGGGEDECQGGQGFHRVQVHLGLLRPFGLVSSCSMPASRWDDPYRDQLHRERLGTKKSNTRSGPVAGGNWA